MNMKKTIAAIAAGSVAVSAMATTVSALEAKTLTYSLVQNVRQNDASGTITYTFNTVPVAAGQEVLIKAIGAGPWSCVVTVSGSYQDVNESIQPTKFTKRDWSDAYDKIPAGMIAGDGDDSVVTIPVVDGIAQGKATNLHSGVIKNLTVTVDYYNLPASVNYTGALNGEINAGRRGIVLTVMNGTGAATALQNATASLTTLASATTVPMLVKDQDALNALAPTDVDSVTYELDNSVAAGAWVTAAAAGSATVTSANLGVAGSGVGSVDTAKVATTLAAKNSGEYTFTVTNTDFDGDGSGKIGWTVFDSTGAVAVAEADGSTGAGMYTNLTATLPAGATFKVNWTKGTSKGSTEAIAGWQMDAALDIPNNGSYNASNDGIKVTITKYVAAAAGAPGTAAYGPSDIAGAATSVSGNTAREIPYRSSLKNSTNITLYNGVNSNGNTIIVSNNAIGGGDVFWKIGLAAADNSTIVASGDVWDYYWPGSYVDQSTLTGYNTYFTSAATGNNINRFWNDANLIAQNARAVVNDAIANYSDVTFVFNTATKNVKVWTDNAGNVYDYEYTGEGATTTKTLTNHNDISCYEQVLDFTSFGRHYWDRDTGYDANTIYIANDWIGNNLFEGALILNNNLTLSLGATDKFDWTSTSLSFSWDAIQDSALTSNAYANYVQNMVLRTSADWYWDNMQVVLGETEDEDVGTTSPVEAEEEELEEVEPEVEAEPEEEPEEEPEVEAEPEVAPAANPGTGNAPVALAVIPVALAAAAIVAKKRG